MVENYIDEAAPILMDILPARWERAVLYAEISESSYEIFYYAKRGGEYIYCYNLKDICVITDDEIDDAMDRWYEIAIKDKKHEKWTSYTLEVEADGAFSVSYSYDEDFDLTEWKKQYLK